MGVLVLPWSYTWQNSFTILPSHRGDVISTNLFCQSGPNTYHTISISCIYHYQLTHTSCSLNCISILRHSDSFHFVLNIIKIRSPSADSFETFSGRELRLSHGFFETATWHSFSLLNTMRVSTKLSPDQNKRRGIIDSAFPNFSAAP